MVMVLHLLKNLVPETCTKLLLQKFDASPGTFLQLETFKIQLTINQSNRTILVTCMQVSCAI